MPNFPTDINQYIKEGGQYCPDCSRPTVTRDEPVVVGHGIIHVHKKCATCLKEWDDIFILCGISDENGKIIT